MEDRQADRIVEAISGLTKAVTELSVKVKRLTNNPITHAKSQEISDYMRHKEFKLNDRTTKEFKHHNKDTK